MFRSSAPRVCDTRDVDAPTHLWIVLPERRPTTQHLVYYTTRCRALLRYMSSATDAPSRECEGDESDDSLWMCCSYALRVAHTMDLHVRYLHSYSFFVLYFIYENQIPITDKNSKRDCARCSMVEAHAQI